MSVYNSEYIFSPLKESNIYSNYFMHILFFFNTQHTHIYEYDCEQIFAPSSFILNVSNRSLLSGHAETPYAKHPLA